MPFLRLFPIILASIIFLIPISKVNCEGSEKNHLIKTSSIQSAEFNINNVRTFVSNNGIMDHQNFISGFYYPSDSRNTLVFQSGLMFGAKINNELRLGGSRYWTTLQPGRIDNNGIPVDQSHKSSYIFTVYKNMPHSYDWDRWPVEFGAPFEDLNNDGIYSPDVDIPGVPGSDQTIWFIVNDMGEVFHEYPFQSKPFGLEIQFTIWGYSNNTPLNNMVFKKFKLINKNKDHYSFDEMYLAMFCDADVHDAGNDFVGCDTTLNLGFAYDGIYSKNDFSRNSQASVGYQLLQGPLVPGLPSDIGNMDGRQFTGMKNLDMTSFTPIFKASYQPLSEDSPIDAWYNYFQGKYADSTRFKLPSYLGGGTTNYNYSGDPITNEGFINNKEFFDGIIYDPQDFRFISSCGSFNMAYQDTQEVIFAEIAAGDSSYSNLATVNLLKLYSLYSMNYYKNNFPRLEKLKPIENHKFIFDKKILLRWDSRSVNKNEPYELMGYKRQGFNIYQLKNSNLQSEKILLKSFDIKDDVDILLDYKVNSQSGFKTFIRPFEIDNKGFEDYYVFDYDNYNQVYLRNGSEYSLGITSFYYNQNDIYPKVIESPIRPITVTPSANKPGEIFNTEIDDFVYSDHIAGNSQGEVYAIVINPKEITGDSYKISFKDSSGVITWEMFNQTNNTIEISNQEIQENPRTKIYNPVIGGMKFFVVNPYIFDSTEVVISTSDVYVITAQANEFSYDLARNQSNKINVFPNPLYGFENAPSGEINRFITFSHLPEKSIITIFTLSGQVVNTLEKNDLSTFQRWNLRNRDGVKVSSGIFIAHVNLPELGKTKILKFAIIQDAMTPDFYYK